MVGSAEMRESRLKNSLAESEWEFRKPTTAVAMVVSSRPHQRCVKHGRNWETANLPILHYKLPLDSCYKTPHRNVTSLAPATGLGLTSLPIEISQSTLINTII